MNFDSCKCHGKNLFKKETDFNVLWYSCICGITYEPKLYWKYLGTMKQSPEYLYRSSWPLLLTNSQMESIDLKPGGIWKVLSIKIFILMFSLFACKYVILISLFPNSCMFSYFKADFFLDPKSITILLKYLYDFLVWRIVWLVSYVPLFIIDNKPFENRWYLDYSVLLQLRTILMNLLSSSLTVGSR